MNQADIISIDAACLEVAKKWEIAAISLENVPKDIMGYAYTVKLKSSEKEAYFSGERIRLFVINRETITKSDCTKNVFLKTAVRIRLSEALYCIEGKKYGKKLINTDFICWLDIFAKSRRDNNYD